jgi:IS605 OrfB family transposase
MVQRSQHSKGRKQMLRTASIKLVPSAEQAGALAALHSAFGDGCNRMVPDVIAYRCWNRVALHHLVYRRIREETSLGAQMVCNAIFAVAKAYRSQKQLGKITKEVVPRIRFDRASVHFDKRTYSLKGEALSLYTLEGRIKVAMVLGDHQRRILAGGRLKEAELVYRQGQWFFNLVVESDTPVPRSGSLTVGVDVGENNLAATSTGKIWGGGKHRHQRDCYLALRRRLQSNGSESARQLLSKVSGRERRHVGHINHEVSQAIVQEAAQCGASRISMEDLTNIRGRIRARRRVRCRLHRWAFRQLQSFVRYKGEAAGLTIYYQEPAYTSQTCSRCGALGVRLRHLFFCPPCGLRAHSDVNASRNLARMDGAIAPSRAEVNQPNVAQPPW